MTINSLISLVLFVFMLIFCSSVTSQFYVDKHLFEPSQVKILNDSSWLFSGFVSSTNSNVTIVDRVITKKNPGVFTDYYLGRYHPGNKTLDWLIIITSSLGNTVINDVKVAEDGNIYITGQCSSSTCYIGTFNLTGYPYTITNEQRTAFVAKVSVTDGSVLLVKAIYSLTGVVVKVTSLIVSPEDQSILVVVHTQSKEVTIDGSVVVLDTENIYSAVVVMYNASGTVQWKLSAAGANIVIDYTFIAVIDNYIYFAFSHTATTHTLAFNGVSYHKNSIIVSKISENGNVTNVKEVYSPQASQIILQNMIATSDGIHIVGVSKGNVIIDTTSVNKTGIFIMRYNHDLSIVEWLDFIEGGTVTYKKSVYSASTNSVYVSTTINGNVTIGSTNIYKTVDSQYLLVKIELDSNGTVNWIAELNVYSHETLVVPTDSSVIVYGWYKYNTTMGETKILTSDTTYPNYFIAKIQDSDGTFLWATTITGNIKGSVGNTLDNVDLVGSTLVVAGVAFRNLVLNETTSLGVSTGYGLYQALYNLSSGHLYFTRIFGYSDTNLFTFSNVIPVSDDQYISVLKGVKTRVGKTTIPVAAILYFSYTPGLCRVQIPKCKVCADEETCGDRHYTCFGKSDTEVQCLGKCIYPSNLTLTIICEYIGRGSCIEDDTCECSDGWAGHDCRRRCDYCHINYK
jgi:hypothetical protein